MTLLRLSVLAELRSRAFSFSGASQFRSFRSDGVGWQTEKEDLDQTARSSKRRCTEAEQSCSSFLAAPERAGHPTGWVLDQPMEWSFI